MYFNFVQKCVSPKQQRKSSTADPIEQSSLALSSFCYRTFSCSLAVAVALALVLFALPCLCSSCLVSISITLWF